MTYINNYQSRPTKKRLWLLGLACAFLTSFASAQEPADFAKLPEELQETLAPFANNWDRLGPQRQLMLIDKARTAGPEERKHFKAQAEHWNNMKPVERRKVRKAQQRFDQLPLHKREKLRHHWKNMSPEERRKLTEKMRKQPQLSPAKQREIREKVKKMTAEERREFLDEIKRQRQSSAKQ